MQEEHIFQEPALLGHTTCTALHFCTLPTNSAQLNNKAVKLSDACIQKLFCPLFPDCKSIQYPNKRVVGS